MVWTNSALLRNYFVTIAGFRTQEFDCLVHVDLFREKHLGYNGCTRGRNEIGLNPTKDPQ